MRWPFHIIVTVAAGACRSRSGRGAKPLESIFEFDREYDLGILSGTGAAPSRPQNAYQRPRLGDCGAFYIEGFKAWCRQIQREHHSRRHQL